MTEDLPKYDVTFFATTDTRHANYTIKGLLELEKQGIIILQFKPAFYQSKNRVVQDATGKTNRSYRSYPWAPELKIKERSSGIEILIAIDLQDWDSMFSYHSLKNCDVIFKRAYTAISEKVSVQFNVPILPAGINHSAEVESKAYLVALKKYRWKHNIRYAIENPKEIIRVLKEKLNFKTTKAKPDTFPLKNISGESLREPPSTPYVFFQVEYHDWNTKESIKINEKRAKIIRSLRHSLGERFIGGMYFKKEIKTPYDDCITNVPFEREIYLKFVQQAAVVISSNGFGDSIPWKLPEYLQMGKCIIAEPLAHQIPVPFKEDEILFFKNAEHCYELCEKLLLSKDLRINMELKTKQYYEEHILPRASILRMIERSFNKSII